MKPTSNQQAQMINLHPIVDPWVWLERKCSLILEWFYVPFSSGSSTYRLFHVCCDGLEVLSECLHTYTKPPQGLGGLFDLLPPQMNNLHPIVDPSGLAISTTLVWLELD